MCVVVTAVLLAAAMVVSCSSTAEVSDGRSSSAAQAPNSPTESSSSSPLVPAGSRAVGFRAVDGVRLEGRLFGSGRIGVVLSHMGRVGDDQSDWFAVASLLAKRGYLVLTYNRRGVCPGGEEGCSSGEDDFGEHWKDVLGALRFLRDAGARTVFIGGASIGAMATFYVAEQPDVDVDGVIWVAGIDIGSGYLFDRKDVSKVVAPKLFIAGRDEPDDASSARRLYRWSVPPRRSVLVDSDEHGTDMLVEDPVGADVTDAILRFLGRYSPRRP